jgi:tetratricopeptide (TPR) repeat protein
MTIRRPIACVLTLTGALTLASCSEVRDGLARLRGDAYRQRGRYADAIQVYNRIPTNRQALAVIEGLADCYARLGALSNAAAAYARVYARSRSEADLVRVIWVLLDNDDHAAALPPLRDLVARQPDEMAYRELLITTQLRSAASNDVARELAQMEDELDATPTNFALLASWHTHAGDHSNAVRLLARAVAAAPDHDRWRVALAGALAEAKQYAAALTNLDVLVARAPDNAEIQQLLGYTLTEMGEVDAGIAAFRRAIKLDQDNALALNNLAYTLLLNDRDLNDAYELAHSAVQNERASFTVDTLAYACYKRGAHTTALRYLQEAQRLRLEEGRAYDAELDFHYGLVLAELGRIDEALPHFREALAAQPALQDLLRRERYFETLQPHLTTHHEQRDDQSRH